MFIGKLFVTICSILSGYDENMDFIKQHNSLDSPYKVGENQFINQSYINGTTNQSMKYIKKMNNIKMIISVVIRKFLVRSMYSDCKTTGF